MVTLQQNFSSMEKRVQTLKDSLEGPNLDPLDLMKVYKDKLLEKMWKQQEGVEIPAAPEEEPASPEASKSLEDNSGESNPLLERLRALEAENSALSLENDNQRKQYERCLDEVANQVVQALLTQKDLKEECVKLRTRVFDLEQQNRILNVLFQQRVKMSTTPVSTEVQMNGKADVTSERWPSLLSLTCQGSSGSGSGSDLSLSRACSEYSSGSYTWAEGHGCSKQCSKRMSACSVYNNHSVLSEQTELGWKEGHILKGLKCLQTSGSKEQSLKSSAVQCNDCMTSNEGIYSLGVNSGPQGSKQRTPIRKPCKACEGFTALGSDDTGDDKMKVQSREDTDQSKENMEVDDGSSTEEPVNSDLFTSPVKDNYQFLETPGVGPTASPPHCDEGQRNKSLSLRHTDRNNNQERSADHESSPDHVPTQHGMFTTNQQEDVAKDLKSPLTHSKTKVLSSPVKEARLCSSLVEVTQWGELVSQPDTKSSQRKLRPQPCDSARKAFILRSKSADGGPAQAKHTHSPLHQKLMKNPWSKGQTSQAGQGIPSKRKNLGKTNVCTTEKEEDFTAAATSTSLENVHHCSPLASPLKFSKTFNKSSGVTDASEGPVKSSQKTTRIQTSNDPVNESGPENLPRQERQEQHAVYSPPPAPPGRTTSLLHRTSHGSSPEAHKSEAPTQIWEAAKKTSCSSKPESRETQGNSKTQALVSRQLSLDISTTFHDAPPALLNHSVLQRSQQSVSEPRLSEVLPHVHTNVFYHGVSRNLNSSTSRAVKTAHPVNVRSNDFPETSTFLINGKPQMKHDGAAHDKAHGKIETRCSSFDCEPAKSEGGMMLDWGFDEEGWLFKRSVSVSTRPLLKPVMGMNGMKARSQSFGARYMDRPNFNRPGNVRTQIKTQSGSSLNSLSDLLPGSMSCSSSYHCPMNQSLLNNFMIEEGLTGPTYLGSSRERLQSIKLQQEQVRRIQIEQQFSSAFGTPVSEEPEIQSTITTIEEKVMLGIEENLHKSQEQEKSSDVKQKSSSSLANWFGLRKSRLPGPSGKKTHQSKGKDDKKEQQVPSLRGGKQAKSDKKKDRRKSDGKDCSVGRRESHDAVRSCISMPCPGVALNEIQGHADISRDSKVRSGDEPGSTVDLSPQAAVTGSSCRMRTLDSGIGTIPLPESCSFFSNILHLLPKPSFTPEQSLKTRCVPMSPSEDVSPSHLPRWRVPAGGKDHRPAGVPNSLSESSMTHIPLVPVPTVALLQPAPPQSEPILTSVSVCQTQSGLSRPRPGGVESRKPASVKPKTKAKKESTRIQLANSERPSLNALWWRSDRSVKCHEAVIS